MIAVAEPTLVKTARKRSAKPVRQEDASKVKATIHISAEAFRRLGIHSTMTGQTNSGVVEALIMDHLRRFVVSDRARFNDGAMPTVSAD